MSTFWEVSKNDSDVSTSMIKSKQNANVEGILYLIGSNYVDVDVEERKKNVFFLILSFTTYTERHDCE
jgi:hypothetical protein